MRKVNLDVAARIRKCHERSGMSLREVDAASGVQFSHVSGIMNGRWNAGLETLEKLAPVYKTTTEWLRNGDPRVDIRDEIAVMPWFEEISNPAVPRGRRVAFILNYLRTRYSGHLSLEDLTDIFGLDAEDIEAIAEEKCEPTPTFVKALSQLCSIPADWFELGNLAKQRLYPNIDMDEDEAKQWLSLAVKAKEAGIALQQLEAIIDALTTKERG